MTILQIDRSKPFDFSTFIHEHGHEDESGDGWHILEQDKRSLELTEIDLTKVSFETMLEREENIPGKKGSKYLKDTEHICLDAKILQALLENKHLIPGSWKYSRVHFHGTIFRSDRLRFVLFLGWDAHKGEWYSLYDLLETTCRNRYASAILAN